MNCTLGSESLNVEIHFTWFTNKMSTGLGTQVIKPVDAPTPVILHVVHNRCQDLHMTL